MSNYICRVMKFEFWRLKPVMKTILCGVISTIYGVKCVTPDNLSTEADVGRRSTKKLF